MCQSVNDDLISIGRSGSRSSQTSQAQVEGGRSAHKVTDNQDKTRNNGRGAGDRVAGGAWVGGGGWILLLFIGKWTCRAYFIGGANAALIKPETQATRQGGRRERSRESE